MRLYLVQHGQALSEEEDARRPLSVQGRQQTQTVARFLREKGIKPDSIWHSKKLRAMQTAEIIASSISGIELSPREDLNPNDPVEKFPQEILAQNRDLMIVGHLPFLQKLAARLLVGEQDYDVISFRYSGVVCLELTQERGKIVWMVVPELL